MSIRSLVLLNLLLLGGLVVRPIGAQTNPETHFDCCKTNSAQEKFCCDDCCTNTDGRCTSTRICQPPADE